MMIQMKSEEGSDDIPFRSFFNQLDEDVTDEELMFLEATMQGYLSDSIMLKRKKQTEDADMVKLPIPTNDCEDPLGKEEDFVEYTIGHGQKPFHIRDIVEVLLTKTTA
ncbi:hypothetical protein SEMRO_563_G167250.1 [Seminavis robusta]|uniref:Uncharacterized protein n=1 Tax=Seminavis robusta TaxID=568900 RepID=A0A9N8E5A3_9STRA|nr:hypothetical protein SEMRO_563_G167250.1 [Seminavis robusta]|eukprot:Sro563_g167250.1 n/a (108) ;mRNA; r:43985-44308